MPTKVLSIVGPTGVGKSNLALWLARQYKDLGRVIEIISMDSALVYKGMDIGTAKPSKAEQAEVAHHLIDVLDPSQNYSAAQFASDAKELISDIKQRGNIPLIVGGTMLYWRAWVYGFSNLPAANPEVRAQLDREAAEIGWPAMHAKLAILDPASAERLQPNDSQRVQRALEVFALTGRPLSDLFEETPSLAGRKQEPTPDWVEVISLEPSDRKTLHTRLEQRFDQMLESKFIEEVEQLRNRGDLHTNLPAIRSVGYRQVWEYLAGDIDFETMKEKAYAATRQLSKRQMTWLRAMDRRVFDPFDTKQMDLAQKQCLALLQ
ncbi:MAG: tRNA (adenosine(37)-N6)-dimethylallyltransferase MiaA [Burkholderiaceae bacterium]|jgi:tRNA dimethylallyltransferase|nr:tRNA (adenosine(37)-N6)-dimethylallyltransferase MiaA [Burkholderiaceae bacterium]NBP92695.1 tRNA (adenosine(37)-N6)-dimethylallyltransferase MiaA [Burkholderiaceae bacterium]NCU79428.1 tRNA (adenosine(37)-N6)-dimethylallyltransferase MiaA [Burkholderiaceae bacterium]NCY00274.1 tRNA (adenosine(37)-N6)-dimethylallyltransferase MiaA [Burkholderiaceae bacterium]